MLTIDKDGDFFYNGEIIIYDDEEFVSGYLGIGHWVGYFDLSYAFSTKNMILVAD